MKDDSYRVVPCGVKMFLERLGLVRYYDMFRAKGFDSEADLRHVDRAALDVMYITNKMDRDLILTYANQYHPNEAFLLHDWLRQHNLEYYYINFIQSGRDTLDILEDMDLPDEEIYDDLEITLPGHKKRLERAVSQLKKQKQINKDAEYPVAYGSWKKPKSLIYAKFNFLCIDASIFSTKHADQSEELEFMVDTGSDVVTLRKDIVEKLNLKELGCVRSKGVHVAKHKILYEAKLKIGSVELKVEVISEEYNSLGNRVFRCFRHYISGSRHIWLKGDYIDPTMQWPPIENIGQDHYYQHNNNSNNNNNNNNHNKHCNHNHNNNNSNISHQNKDYKDKELIQGTDEESGDDDNDDDEEEEEEGEREKKEVEGEKQERENEVDEDEENYNHHQLQHNHNHNNHHYHQNNNNNTTNNNKELTKADENNDEKHIEDADDDDEEEEEKEEREEVEEEFVEDNEENHHHNQQQQQQQQYSHIVRECVLGDDSNNMDDVTQISTYSNNSHNNNSNNNNNNSNNNNNNSISSNSHNNNIRGNNNYNNNNNNSNNTISNYSSSRNGKLEIISNKTGGDDSQTQVSNIEDREAIKRGGGEGTREGGEKVSEAKLYNIYAVDKTTTTVTTTTTTTTITRECGDINKTWSLETRVLRDEIIKENEKEKTDEEEGSDRRGGKKEGEREGEKEREERGEERGEKLSKENLYNIHVVNETRATTTAATTAAMEWDIIDKNISPETHIQQQQYQQRHLQHHQQQQQYQHQQQEQYQQRQVELYKYSLTIPELYKSPECSRKFKSGQRPSSATVVELEWQRQRLLRKSRKRKLQTPSLSDREMLNRHKISCKRLSFDEINVLS